MIGGLIIVGFLIIAIVIAFVYFSTFFENLYIAFAEKQELAKNIATARVGSTVCQLRFEVFVSYDEAPFGFDFEQKQRLWLGIPSPNSGGQAYHPEVANHIFRDCETKQSGISGFLQLVSPSFTLEKVQNVQASLLAFTNITPQEFQTKMEFFRVDDGRSLGIKTLRTSEPAGAKLPFRDQGVFIFDNVELGQYNVHITCEGDCAKVNALPSGEPFIYKIRL